MAGLTLEGRVFAPAANVHVFNPLSRTLATLVVGRPVTAAALVAAACWLRVASQFDFIASWLRVRNPKIMESTPLTTVRCAIASRDRSQSASA